LYIHRLQLSDTIYGSLAKVCRHCFGMNCKHLIKHARRCFHNVALSLTVTVGDKTSMPINEEDHIVLVENFDIFLHKANTEAQSMLVIVDCSY